MNDDDRDIDPVVARALHDLPIPEHGPDFWAELDDRLAAAAPARPPSTHLAASDHANRDEAPPDGVIALREARQRRDLSRRWLVAAAAAVLAVALGVVLRPGGDDTVETADPGPDTSTPSDPTTPDTSAPFGGDVAGPEQAVTAWLDAVGTGDIETARLLTGPRTVAYIESLGGNIDGFLQESAEGWGAWPASPDLQVSTHAPPEETGVLIVVLQGTWTGEGDTYFRTDAIPVVHEDGRWLVEINAFRPDVGGRIEFVSPEVDGGGFGITPDTDIVVSAPGGGDFYAAFDDPGLNPLPGESAAGTTRATFRHGNLRNGTHLLVVAYLDGDTITAFTGPVTVEG